MLQKPHKVVTAFCTCQIAGMFFSGQSTHIPYSSDASRSTDIWDFYPSPKPPSMDKTSTKIYNHLTTKLSGILTVESSKTCESHLLTQQKDIPQKWGGGSLFLAHQPYQANGPYHRIVIWNYIQGQCLVAGAMKMFLDWCRKTLVDWHRQQKNQAT